MSDLPNTLNRCRSEFEAWWKLFPVGGRAAKEGLAWTTWKDAWATCKKSLQVAQSDIPLRFEEMPDEQPDPEGDAYARGYADGYKAKAIEREIRNRWQSLETAPKDGSPVMIWLDDEGFAVKANWTHPPHNDSEDNCWWCYEMDLALEDFHNPTHWQPCLEGPTEIED